AVSRLALAEEAAKDRGAQARLRGSAPSSLASLGRLNVAAKAGLEWCDRAECPAAPHSPAALAVDARGAGVGALVRHPLQARHARRLRGLPHRGRARARAGAALSARGRALPVQVLANLRRRDGGVRVSDASRRGAALVRAFGGAALSLPAPVAQAAARAAGPRRLARVAGR